MHTPFAFTDPHGGGLLFSLLVKQLSDHSLFPQVLENVLGVCLSRRLRQSEIATRCVILPPRRQKIHRKPRHPRSASRLTTTGTFETWWYPKHNRRAIGEILAEFRSARSRLMSRVEKIDPANFSRTLLHPRLKTPMRLVDHLYFVAEHDDHHLAHIWELIEASQTPAPSESNSD